MFAFVSRLLTLVVLCTGLAAGAAQALTVTDVENRTVEIKDNPQRIVVGNYILNFLMVGGAESLSRVVALPQDDWEGMRKGEYTVLTKAFPEIKKLPSIGGYHDDILNTEKIIALKPDVLLVGRTQYASNDKRIAVLARAGIPTIVLDYHAMTVENHTLSTEILGKLLDRTETADKLNARYKQITNIVRERLAKLPKEAKFRRVYAETGSKGPDIYGNSYNNTVLWGGMLHNLDADNIAGGMKQPYASLTREYILSQNPQTIVITGSIWLGAHETDQMRMGLTVKESEAQKRLAGFATRPEWKNVEAVKTGEIYGVDHGSLRTIGDYVFLMNLAKILYPDTFADFDPAGEYARFWRETLPQVDASGTYFVKLAR